MPLTKIAPGIWVNPSDVTSVSIEGFRALVVSFKSGKQISIKFETTLDAERSADVVARRINGDASPEPLYRHPVQTPEASIESVVEHEVA